MAQLIAVTQGRSTATSHAVFVHGLGGNHNDTWLSSGKPARFWPEWLAEDIPHLVIWTLAYEASVSRWRGSAMHLVDRADNVLALMLAEPRLRRGEITLVGHSLGGLVIKQIIRTADVQADRDARAAQFLRSVRRVAFLGTPHFGAGLASISDRLRIFLRPSAATASLVRNDPNLRGLNNWYRESLRVRGIEHLVLAESQSLSIFGLVVPPDSSDPALEVRAVPVDSNHVTICKPASRHSEVYVLIHDFISRPLRLRDTLTTESGTTLSSILEGQTDLAQAVASIKALIQEQGRHLGIEPDDVFMQPLRQSNQFPSQLVDDAIRNEVGRLRRARFFAGYSADEQAQRLAQKVLSGEFGGGSSSARCFALAWCARVVNANFLSRTVDELIAVATQLCDLPEVRIAQARRSAAQGNLPAALEMLARLESAVARSAAFILVTKHQSPAAAIQWLADSQLSFSDLDGDGKFFLLVHELELGQLDAAVEHLKSLDGSDFDNSPVLFHAAGMTCLLQAVPEELRPVLLRQLPLDLKGFPLSSTDAAKEARDRARVYFTRCAEAARELDCIPAANVADDYALWLELRDPSSSVDGHRRLEASLRDPAQSLRRVQFGFQFNVPMDLGAIEAEIDRRVALSGGRASSDVGFARLCLALAQRDARQGLEYIVRHRAQLSPHIEPASLRAIEIEMLARAGSVQKARELLDDPTSSMLSGQDRERLADALGDATDEVTILKARYGSSGSLITLVELVRALEAKDDWNALAQYAPTLFEKTRALQDAERAAHALHRGAKPADLGAFLRSNFEFVEQSQALKLLWSWWLYREGSLVQARSVLRDVQVTRDDPQVRQLAVNIAIASGDWESLVTVVEREWVERERRDAKGLMISARLAQMIGSPRGRDLVFAAVRQADDDPAILAGAYFFASSAGWEDDPVVSDWLARATRLSGESGPIQTMSIRDVLDRKPEWDRRERETWDLLRRGQVPIFGAAQQLRRSLVEWFLLPALANRAQADVRNRRLVPAYGGARIRPQVPRCTRIAVDATALLTLAFLDRLEELSRTFQQIAIPHSTLGWLFEERHKIAFHQPSRVRAAHELRQMLATNDLHEFLLHASIDPDLAADVGEELASLIAEAQNESSTSAESQRLVIVSAPVHRIGSLMEEEADLARFTGLLASCMSVVDKLKQKGQLTAEEELRVRAYHESQGRRWPNEPEIADNAVLYLDDVVVAQLRHTDLLTKLRPAGLRAFVSSRELAEASSLIGYEQLSESVSQALERLRSWLAAGISSETIKVGSLETLTDSSDFADRFDAHPAISVVRLASEVDAIVSDDRFLNQHNFFDHDATRTPILSTIDILDLMAEGSALSFRQWLDCRTTLRQAGFAFVPVSDQELNAHLSTTAIRNGELVETAELRAFRENLLVSRMSGFLQLPAEAPWLTAIATMIANTIRMQWTDEIPDELALARCTWLIRLLDMRGWAGSFDGVMGIPLAESGYAAQLMQISFIVPGTVSGHVAKRYTTWINDTLASVQEADTVTYDWMVNRARELVAAAVERHVPGGATDE